MLFFIDLLLVFQKDLMICIQTNWAINNIYEKNIFCLKRVDEIHTQMLEINVKYRVAKKPRYYFFDLLVVFQKYALICNDSS